MTTEIKSSPKQSFNRITFIKQNSVPLELPANTRRYFVFVNTKDYDNKKKLLLQFKAVVKKFSDTHVSGINHDLYKTWWKAFFNYRGECGGNDFGLWVTYWNYTGDANFTNDEIYKKYWKRLGFYETDEDI